MEPMVSITVSSYKHAKYLPTCLDSLLNQKTNFHYEVVVGEDCSNDGSKEILLDYQAKYPDKLVVIFNETNLGVSKNGLNIRKKCRGKYLASCESDDFWCDENKLQKQFDYLEAHPEIAAVGSNNYFVDDDGNNPRLALRKSKTDRVYTLKDYMRYGFTIHGNTLMRRSETTPSGGEKYEKLRLSVKTQGDIITRCLIYDKGGIYVFPEPMLCHRDGSAVATSYSAQNINNAIKYTYMFEDMKNALNEYFEGKYDFSPIVANRMAFILFGRIFGNLKFEFKEFFKIYKSLKLSQKLKVVRRFFAMISDKVCNMVYWRFHDRSQYKG